MVKKLAMIGIDSMDPFILQKYQSELPNFSKIMRESPTLLLNSVYPVDTIPSWVTVFTGKEPSNHGILYVYDIFNFNQDGLQTINLNQIRGKTFWDYANVHGYRTAVLFPNLIYPPWPIDGIMVSKSPHERRTNWIKTEIDVSCVPEDLHDDYNVPKSIEGLWGGYPGDENIFDWANLGKTIIEQEKEIGLQVFLNGRWDIYFIYFSLLDIVQHRLWRFFDPNDPLYPGDNEFSKIILDYYRLFDSIIGEYLSIFPDISYIILSDHGHKSRPYKTINLNELLRVKGYLVPRQTYNILFKAIRRYSLYLIDKMNLETHVIRLLANSGSLTNTSKNIYAFTGSVDQKKSLACLSDFAGIKSYPSGGIAINRDQISPREYETIRNELLDLLQKPIMNQYLFNWIGKREDIVPGECSADIYPDIVFELKDGYGVGWSMYTDLIDKAHDHKIASGGHRKEGVLLCRNIGEKSIANWIRLSDVAPTIMDIMDIEVNAGSFDGTSFLSRCQ